MLGRKIREELRDPWAVLAAGVIGGAAWAVGVPPAVAAGVGAAVLGVKTIVGALSGPRSEGGPRFLPIREKSPEERWLKRAEKAVRSFDRLAGSVRPGPVAQRCVVIRDQVRTTIEAMRRLAGQASALAMALGHVDAARLHEEQNRLEEQTRRAREPEVRDELERSLASVREQQAVRERLEQAGRTLLARLESGAIGLEGLVARLAEVLALAETASSSDQGAGRIDELADELEGLRAGLAETEDLSRRALTAYRESA